jgi:hypothetical protein
MREGAVKVIIIAGAPAFTHQPDIVRSNPNGSCAMSQCYSDPCREEKLRLREVKEQPKVTQLAVAGPNFEPESTYGAQRIS